MFGKLMSISDELMWTYWELVTDRTEAWIAEIRKTVAEGTTHPMDVKMRLAQEIIGQFHGRDAAKQAVDFRQQLRRSCREIACGRIVNANLMVGSTGYQNHPVGAPGHRVHLVRVAVQR